MYTIDNRAIFEIGNMQIAWPNIYNVIECKKRGILNYLKVNTMFLYRFKTKRFF